MTSDAEAVSVLLDIDAGEESDSEELDRLTRQLRDEIKEIDVESVEIVRGGAAPAGAKAVELTTMGSLAVAVLPAVIPPLIQLVTAWVQRGDNRKIRIKTNYAGRSVEVELSPKTMSADEMKAMIDTLLARKPKQA
jgi:hypothetical protein